MRGLFRLMVDEFAEWCFEVKNYKCSAFVKVDGRLGCFNGKIFCKKGGGYGVRVFTGYSVNGKSVYIESEKSVNSLKDAVRTFKDLVIELNRLYPDEKILSSGSCTFKWCGLLKELFSVLEEKGFNIVEFNNSGEFTVGVVRNDSFYSLSFEIVDVDENVDFKVCLDHSVFYCDWFSVSRDTFPMFVVKLLSDFKTGKFNFENHVV